MKTLESMMKTARIGDKVSCMGITAEIGKLYYSDHYDGQWDIEFVDTTGQYRHWKQIYDGGTYIRTLPEYRTEYFQNFDGLTATVEYINEYLNETAYFDVRLTVTDYKGQIIHTRKYKTHKGAMIALGRLSTCSWDFVGSEGKTTIKI